MSGSGLNLGGLVSIILTFTLLASIGVILLMNKMVLLKVLHGLNLISSIATTFSLVEAINNHLLRESLKTARLDSMSSLKSASC